MEYITHTKEKNEKIITITPIINEITKCSENKSTFLTKTAELLKDILQSEEIEMINKFDRVRNQFKLNKTDDLLMNTYMDIVVRFEVQILNTEDKLKAELKILEEKQWQKDTGLNLFLN